MRLPIPIQMFIAFLFLQCVHLQAQRPVFHAKNLGIRDGLSHSIVNAVAQDSLGRIWLGTAYGLCSFDGYDFNHFLFNNKQIGVGINYINVLRADLHNRLWIGTQNGLVCFNLQTEQHELIPLPEGINYQDVTYTITRLALDSDQHLWIVSNLGIKVYDTSKKAYIKLPWTTENVADIALVKRGNIEEIWLASHEKNLIRIDKKTLTLQVCDHVFQTRPELVPPVIHALLPVSDSLLLLGTSKGVFRFSTNSLNAVLLAEAPPGSIFKMNTLLLDANHTLWVPTLHEGLYYLDKSDMRFKRPYAPLEDAGISYPHIQTLFADRSGILWIGTHNNGVYLGDSRSKNFHTFSFLNSGQKAYENADRERLYALGAVVADHRGNIWGGDQYGRLISFNPFGSQKNIVDLQKYHTGESSVYPLGGLTFDKQGRLWFASWSGYAGYLDHNRKPVFLYGGGKDLRGWSFRSILCDRDGLIWLGSRAEGLQTIEINGPTRNDLHISSPPISEEIDPEVYCLYESRLSAEKVIWIGTRKGIYKYEVGKNSCTSYYLNINRPNWLWGTCVHCFAEDSHGRLWVGSGDGGLFLFNAERHDFQNYTTSHGLPSNNIFAIYPDQNGYLWLSTNMGIARFDPGTQSSLNFDLNDGIVNTEMKMGAHFRDSRGNILFGNNQGLVLFHPDSILSNQYPSYPLITRVKTYGNPIMAGDTLAAGFVLQQAIPYTRKIRLSYDQRVMTIEFSALHYLNPDRIKYAYMMEGYNSDWIQTDSKHRSVTYTNLPPGDYVFRLKATNSDGIWSDAEARLAITIVPPFWKHWLFVLLVILGVGGSGGGFFYSYLLKKKRQEKKLQITIRKRTSELMLANALLDERKNEIMEQNEELRKYQEHLEEMVRKRTAQLERAKHKAEESDRLKSAFLANLSHEIRTPMNAIVGFSTILQDDDLTETERKEYIQSIADHSDQLLVLINDLVDISQIEAGLVTPQIKVLVLDDFLTLLYFYWKTKNARSLVSVELKKTPEGVERFYTDENLLRKILDSLISNALKFTNTGHVRFGLESCANGKAVFFVEDTGIGIPPEALPRIFDRFRKIEYSRDVLQGGTGIGLALTRKIIELLNGGIEVKSEVGKGTVFRFWVQSSVEEIRTNNHVED